MSDAKGQHEPSMEEILASIRRIIAEDSDAPVTADDAAPQDAKPAAAPAAGQAAVASLEPAPAAKEEDILELTEVIEDPPADVAAAAAPSQPEEPAMSIDSETPEPHIVTPAAAERSERDRLLSNTTAAASVAALSQLVVRPRDKSGELPLGAADRTLEDIVRELMRPLLKDWLDEHLPGLVERLVKDEITRLVREAQGT